MILLPYAQATLSVYLLFNQNDQILLLKRQNTGYHDGQYGLVAGHVDSGEPVIKAAIREAQEEAGVILMPEDLEIVHILQRFVKINVKGNQERIDFFLRPKKWIGDPKNNEPDKCSELKWFALNNLPSNTIPYIQQTIKNIYHHRLLYNEMGF